MTYTWQKFQVESETNNNDFFSDLKESYSLLKCDKTKSKVNVSINKKMEGVVFLAETLKEEVVNGSKKEQKKNLKQLKKLFLQLSVIALTIGIGTGLEMITAQPLTASANTNLPTKPDIPAPITDIDPSEVMKWGMMIALIIVAIGVAIGISAFAIAGIYLMITRKRTEASAWTSDIIKGVTQVLVAIPLIYAIFQLAQTIFQNIPFLSGLM